jgi:hypothetical protein
LHCRHHPEAKLAMFLRKMKNITLEHLYLREELSTTR